MPSVEEEDNAPEGTVEVRFHVSVPRLTGELATKAETRSTDPEIRTMDVAVFGGSGYMKEYKRATLKSVATQNYDGTARTVYEYSVRLSLTNSSIKVHFIANGPATPPPFNYESSNIPLLTRSVTDEYTDAYWQRILVPDGITAYKYDGVSYACNYGGETHYHTGASYTDHNNKTVRKGDYINVDGNLSDGTDYMVSTKTIEDLSDIKLIRNFAKVSVEAAPKATSWFELISYTVINEPTKGTISTYPFNGTWIDYLSYNDSVYPYVANDPTSGPYRHLNAVYPGSLASGTTFDPTVPDPDWVAGNAAASPWKNPVAPVLLGSAPSFIYERPVPDATPTHLLVYGKFYQNGEGSGTPCFYKIDLMEDGRYFALYRNFQYKITIKQVKKIGKTTAGEAERGSGSGDVSADVDAKNLTEISDGECQLYVSDMAPVLVGQHSGDNAYKIQYKFITDITEGDNSVANDHNEQTGDGPKYISFTANVENLSTGERVIDSYVAAEADVDNFRTITFNTTAPGGSQKKETFRISAVYTAADQSVHRLYRDVVFTLLQKQEMKIMCIKDDILAGKDKLVTARLLIPRGLPQSMFPLQFPIEFVNKTLGPDYVTDPDQNLPVKYGQTYEYTESVGVKTRKNKQSFYFIRTLTWDEYLTYSGGESGSGAGSQIIESDGKNWVYFDSYFKTIEVDSATDVYAGCLNSDGTETGTYFDPCKTAITNYTEKSFGWGADPVLVATEEATITFTMDPSDYDHVVTVTLEDVEPIEGDSGLTKVSEGVYRVNGAQTVEFRITAPSEGRSFTVGLQADHYADASKTFTVPVKVTSISLNDLTGTHYVGDTGLRFEATVNPSGALASNPVTWTSSDPNIVSVAGSGDGNRYGDLTLKAAGTVTITATAGGKSASKTITVNSLNMVTLTPPSGNDGNNSWGSRTATNPPFTVTFSSARRTNNGYIRVQANSRVSFSSTGNRTIRRIVIHFYNSTNTGGTATWNPNTGSYTINGTEGTWGGSSVNPYVSFSSEARISSIDVYYQ